MLRQRLCCCCKSELNCLHLGRILSLAAPAVFGEISAAIVSCFFGFIYAEGCIGINLDARAHSGRDADLFQIGAF